MRIRVTISGMLSVHAKRAVFTALGGVPRITRADVEMGSAIVEGEQVDEQALRAAIEGAGCQVTQVELLRRELPLA